MQNPIDRNQRNRSYPQSNWNVNIPTNQPCQIYPRVSTPEQMENVSAEMQKDKSFAISCGWTEERIILDDRDLGISGQVRMEDRPAFTEMLRRIANGQIKAVVTVQVDRLFRNKWGDESGKFMEICFRYGVIVVTPDFIYDFRISWHIDRFKRRCEEAWNYLEYHVYGRLHPAQDARGYAGFWTGGNVPLGYIVDSHERVDGQRNPNYYRYTVYEPHAEIIRWMFRKFKELHGNVTALMVEIEKRGVLFPDFDESVDPFMVHACYSASTKVAGGYTIVSDRGLRNMLQNRIYIGHWIYKKELISTQYPDPIVKLDLFTYAYNRLSAVSLDGTPNERALEQRRRYAKRHFADKPAILKNCIYAADPKVKIYVKEIQYKGGTRCHYGFFPERAGNIRQSATSVIVASGLDAVVLERLREHLQQPEAEEAFEGFAQEDAEVVNEASETLKDIERDIAAMKSLMTRTLEQIKSGKLTNPDLAQAANDSYEAAQVELQRLEERKGATTQIAQEDEERRSYKKLMKDVGEAWDEIVLPEEYPRLVHLFITSVTLAPVSPNFFSATIVWRDPSWGVDTGLCYKGTFASLLWTQEEVAILMEHYPTATRQELTKLLPRRNFLAMRGYFKTRGIKVKRPVKKEEGIPYAVCLDDWRLMQQYGITEDDIKQWNSVRLIVWDFPPLCLVAYYRAAESHVQAYAQERSCQPTLCSPTWGTQCRTHIPPFCPLYPVKREGANGKAQREATTGC